MHSGEVILREPIVPQKSQMLSRRDVYLSTGVIILSFSVLLAGIAQSVYRLATGWTDLGSNPGGGEISPPV